MKLITKEIERRLPKLGSTEQVPMEKKKVICKFFAPWGRWSWYVTEGERQPSGDILFFGYVVGQYSEWGYFSLKELQSIRGMFGLGIERDMYLPKNMVIGDIQTGAIPETE